MKDTDGNVLAGAGTQFTMLGKEHEGLYVEDEDNYYSCIKQPSSPYLTSYYVEDEDNVGSVPLRGSRYNDDVDLFTRSGGIECYKTSAYTSNKLYISTGGVYRELGQTLYTRSSGAVRYTTSKVDTPLYRDGGTHTYTLYKSVSKNLYAEGSTVTYPAYKAYGGKVYDAGQTAVISPAEITTQNVIALTV